MKYFLPFLTVAAAFLYQSTVQAQVAVGPGSVKLDKVEVQGVKTPEYTIQGGPQKRSENKTWLEVEVEFDTKVPEIDELTFTYTIAIEGKLATGSVTHINIPEGKKHFSVVYIAPRSLEKLTGGKPLTGASVQNAWVTVTRQGQTLAPTASMKPGNVPNLPQMAGMVLNKMETPFAPLFFDRYEAVKITK